MALCLIGSSALGQQPGKPQGPESPGSTHIQGAVIIAHLEQDVDFQSSEALQPVLGQLREIFGYDVYRLEEVTTEDLERKGQVTRIETRPFSAAFTWLGAGEAPGQGKTAAAPATPAPNPEANMHHFKLQIFQKEELIVETEVEVTRNSPFYIKGPEWGRSQIIFMILVGDSPLRQEQEAAPAR